MNSKISTTVLVMLLGWGVEQSTNLTMPAHLHTLQSQMQQVQNERGNLPHDTIASSEQDASGQGVPEGRRGGGTR